MQKMSELKNGSDASCSGKDEPKRKKKLSVKALTGKIEKLQKERRASVNNIKALIHSTKDLMQTNDNASIVRSQLENLMKLFDDATLQHKAVIPLLSEEEQEKLNEWFMCITEHITGFIDDTKTWLSELGRPFPDNMDVNTAPRLHITGNDQHVQDETHTSVVNLPDTVTHDIQDEIEPSDSVSNVGSRKSGRQSKSRRQPSSIGKRSSHSTTSSACIKAEADMAALIARQHLLKEKHDLEDQEEQLRKRKEQLELQAEIAASIAKVNVLRGSCIPSVVSSTSNGMESYFERGQNTKKAVNPEAGSFLPLSVQQDGQILPAGGNVEPHLMGARPKDGNGKVQPQTTLLMHTQLQKHQNTSQSIKADIHSPNVTSHNAAVVSGSSDQNPVFAVMEKQNKQTK